MTETGAAAAGARIVARGLRATAYSMVPGRLRLLKSLWFSLARGVSDAGFVRLFSCAPCACAPCASRGLGHRVPLRFTPGLRSSAGPLKALCG